MNSKSPSNLESQSLWRGVYCITMSLQLVLSLILISSRGSVGKTYFCVFTSMNLGLLIIEVLQISALKLTVIN